MYIFCRKEGNAMTRLETQVLDLLREDCRLPLESWR